MDINSLLRSLGFDPSSIQPDNSINSDDNKTPEPIESKETAETKSKDLVTFELNTYGDHISIVQYLRSNRSKLNVKIKITKSEEIINSCYIFVKSIYINSADNFCSVVCRKINNCIYPHRLNSFEIKGKCKIIEPDCRTYYPIPQTDNIRLIFEDNSFTKLDDSKIFGDVEVILNFDSLICNIGTHNIGNFAELINLDRNFAGAYTANITVLNGTCEFENCKFVGRSSLNIDNELELEIGKKYNHKKQLISEGIHNVCTKSLFEGYSYRMINGILYTIKVENGRTITTLQNNINQYALEDKVNMLTNIIHELQEKYEALSNGCKTNSLNNKSDINITDNPIDTSNNTLADNLVEEESLDIPDTLDTPDTLVEEESLDTSIDTLVEEESLDTSIDKSTVLNNNQNHKYYGEYITHLELAKARTEHNIYDDMLCKIARSKLQDTSCDYLSDWY